MRTTPARRCSCTALSSTVRRRRAGSWRCAPRCRRRSPLGSQPGSQPLGHAALFVQPRLSPPPPAPGQGLTLRAGASALLDRLADAAADARAAVRLAPQRADAHACLAFVLTRLDDAEGARTHLKHAERLPLPRLVHTTATTQVLEASWRRTLAALRLALARADGTTDHEMAAVHLEGAIAVGSPGSAEDARELGCVCYELGRRHRRNNDLAAALAAFQRAVAADPGHAAAHSRAGLLLFSCGKHGEAVAALERAAALVPGDEDYAKTAALARGGAAQAAGDHRAAVAAYAAAVERWPDSATAHSYLGQAHLRLGEHEDAAAAFRRAADLEPGNSAHLDHLAQAFAEASVAARARSDLAAALTFERRAAEALAGDSSAAYRLAFAQGQAALQAGDHAAAVAAFGRAIEADPHDAEAHASCGAALVGLGDPSAAVACYAAALELHPGDAGYRASLAQALHAKGCEHLAAGEYPEAIAALEQAAQLDPRRTYQQTLQNVAQSAARKARRPEGLLRGIARLGLSMACGSSTLPGPQAAC